MNPVPILWISITACGLGLAGVAAGFSALVLARRDTRLANRRAGEKHLEIQEAVAAVRHEMETYASRLTQFQEEAQAPAGAVAVPSGFNLNKRSQILRLNRRGEAPEQIAAALGVPRQEVDLVLKVHRIVLDSV